VPGDYSVNLLLSFPNPSNSISANFKIDTGCRPDLVITEDIVQALGLTMSKTKTVPLVQGSQVFSYTEEPVNIQFTTGRNTVRTHNTTRTFLGGYNLLGKQAMASLGITIPRDASPGVIFIFDFPDDEF
jgi:predicted aspartyl protease